MTAPARALLPASEDRIAARAGLNPRDLAADNAHLRALNTTLLRIFAEACDQAAPTERKP